MRVLLARRFRGNRNAAQSLEEEEGDDYLLNQGEILVRDAEENYFPEENEEPEAIAIQDPSLPPPKHNQTPPGEDLSRSNPDTAENNPPPPPASAAAAAHPKQLSVAASLPPQPPTKPSPQRKRRLAKSASSTEENDSSKFRRRQAPSTKEEATSFWDRKPRARETGIERSNRKKTPGLFSKETSSSSATGKKATPNETNRLLASQTSPLSKIPSHSSKATSPGMVSSGSGRNTRHDDSRDGEDEEQLLAWRYNGIDHPSNRPAHGGTEFLVRTASEEDPAGFDGPLENDPASARGDVSSVSPERQRLGGGSSSASAARPRDARFAAGDEGSPLAAHGGTQRRMAAAPGRWIAAAPGSEQKPTVEEARFREVLRKERGLEIREQDGDGNCLFRAISLQVYGDPSMHGDVRKQCLDHMERDQEHFSQFVTGEPFLRYVARTRQDGVHGNNPEIQACSELFNRPIEVFTPENGSSPLNIFHAEYKTGDVPIRLSYHDGNHYNAVIDPLVPTAGLGLGLPGLKPGYADKMQMDKAVAESMDAAADQDETELQQVLKASQLEYNTKNGHDSDDELQRAIKESQLSAEHMSSNTALSLSDMDATYFELEQAALERSLQSYSQKEEGKKQSALTPPSRSSSGDHKAPAVASVAAPSPTASLPCPSQESIPVAAAAASSVAAARGGHSSSPTPPQRLLPVEEYPSSVQELVMNGFPLKTVVQAFDLVGNNFDHMLSLCLANANR